jgi:hypothetical protein
LEKDLVLANKTMMSFYHCVIDLAADNCSLGQDEVKGISMPFQLFERAAFDLGRACWFVKNLFGKQQRAPMSYKNWLYSVLQDQFAYE